MKRTVLCVLVGALAFAPAGCKRKAVQPRQTLEEGTSVRKASVVRMGDPAAAGQLVKGFHSIEGGSWRWTQKQFTVTLGTPVGAGATGASLTLRFSIPSVSIGKLGPLTLTASINGTDLGPQTYSAPGPQAYQRSVPANLLNTGSVDVMFQLDKAMPPGAADARELGIVAVSAALEAK